MEHRTPSAEAESRLAREQPGQRQLLICVCGGLRCGIPLVDVSEVMRPLPVATMAGPDHLAGASAIRGEPAPVIDLGRLITGAPTADPRRMVVIKVGHSRVVGLWVSEVVGIRAEARLQGGAVPLLENAPAGVIKEVGMLDDALLATLRTALLVPEEIWTELEHRP